MLECTTGFVIRPILFLCSMSQIVKLVNFIFQLEHALVTRARQVWTRVLMIMLVVTGQYVIVYLGLPTMVLLVVS